MTAGTIADKSVNLLLEISKTAKLCTASDVLRSYYLSKCKKLCFKENFSVPNEILATNKRCSRCLLAFNEHVPSCRILKQRRKTRFIRRLQSKVSNKGKLTSFQEKNAKKIGKDMNKLLIKCSVCGNKQISLLEKPILPKSNISLDNQSTKSKKKRKKKDQLAGLNAKYVLSTKQPKLQQKQNKKQNYLNKSPNQVKPRKPVTPKIKQMLMNSSVTPSLSLGDFLNSLSK